MLALFVLIIGYSCNSVVLSASLQSSWFILSSDPVLRFEFWFASFLNVVF